jgi:hypothetical protein
VAVPKKCNKIRACVDFRDLNRVSLEDDFSLPHIDMLVDNAAKKSICFFIDGFSSYIQIKIVNENKEKTTFINL